MLIGAILNEGYLTRKFAILRCIKTHDYTINNITPTKKGYIEMHPFGSNLF